MSISRTYLPAAHFHFLTAAYEIMMRPFLGHVWSGVADEIEVAARRNASVVDLGCGPGTVLRRLAQRRPDLALTGIDIDRGVLSIAQRRLKSAILICGNVAEVPLKDGSADFIFSTIMFHHLERELKIKAFKEAMRLRKDSGHFYLCDFSLPTNVLGRLVVKTLGSLEQGVKSQARGELLEIANGIGLRAVELRRYLGSIALYEISR